MRAVAVVLTHSDHTGLIEVMRIGTDIGVGTAAARTWRQHVGPYASGAFVERVGGGGVHGRQGVSSAAYVD